MIQSCETLGDHAPGSLERHSSGTSCAEVDALPGFSLSASSEGSARQTRPGLSIEEKDHFCSWLLLAWSQMQTRQQDAEEKSGILGKKDPVKCGARQAAHRRSRRIRVVCIDYLGV